MIRLKFIITEKSKDSHSRYETYVLEGNTLRYEKRYSLQKFKNKPPVEKQIDLTEEKINALKTAVLDLQLNRDIESPKHNEFHIPYTSEDVVLETSMEGKSTRINLYHLQSEMTKIFPEYSSILQVKKIMEEFLQ